VAGKGLTMARAETRRARSETIWKAWSIFLRSPRIDIRAMSRIIGRGLNNLNFIFFENIVEVARPNFRQLPRLAEQFGHAAFQPVVAEDG
jgi:hypothetical protein